MLNDLLDKAQSELDDTRHAVSNAAHNFAMLKQSLEDQLAHNNKALEKAKADSLAAEKVDLAEAERVWPLWRRHRPQARTVVLGWLRITRPPWNLLRTS